MYYKLDSKHKFLNTKPYYYDLLRQLAAQIKTYIHKINGKNLPIYNQVQGQQRYLSEMAN